MNSQVKYQVWVRSRGANPYGANLNVPCRNATFDTQEEAQAYCNNSGPYNGNHYYVKEINIR